MDLDLDLKGSKTEANLAAAFAAEAQTCCRYTFFAERAEQEGYKQVAATFRTLAAIEKEHARLWFRIINYGDVPTTERNLLSASECERFEHASLYSRFADAAKEEGFARISNLMSEMARIEQAHESVLRQMHTDIVSGMMFCTENESPWRCMACDHSLTASAAPEVCPVCGAAQSTFEKQLAANISSE